MFKKILIANRGEIAVRIIRTCREMGIGTVAVFSEADRLALHVRLADEARLLGPAPARESYLVPEKIIAAARASGAEAIHPGYGFLSENAAFAEAVAAAGLVFIGPPAQAMRKMGDKVAARQLMMAAGVPVVPGTHEPVTGVEQARALAAEIGYPVLLKAAAGGGGKGMRLVHRPEDLPELLRTAASEAQSAFADGRVFLEKYVEQPRHIEFQILADRFGNVIHLGERECSIQRRHQKVIEEAPSTLLDPGMRREMGEAAVAAAQSCGYVNAGTVEFIVDEHRRYYFLEMNTRLQVEHPVTEMVTGLDLVRLQIAIAAGQRLPLSQAEVKRHGHAIACRIYAEDPENNFLPAIGRLRHLHKPDGFGIREDSGVEEGGEISVYYDPLIAKLMAWGATREEAIQRMRRALTEYEIGGVKTTIPFCLWVMQHPRFRAGEFDTHFVQNEFTPALLAQHRDGYAAERDLPAAAALAAVLKQETATAPPLAAPGNGTPPASSNWRRRGWRENMQHG
ncbi:MAG: acetyl-CoA carboxylase biotin carboxylase subunit [candidate division KSB1 bacterium]|nr:acetyl-CoA carboxylase biotin carboxylase subunit [candidate division KSB1 bacterium]MDZ7273388.1 acetyl-CoA carboxylase biotin carboxylase subunit [candidate division KSB1 bacterium]MDZ7288050.1 acetyl-CoA carboxylase biotin carboxylase subunit [candidate division KSB1 bacterium]MDZ7300098.1 acetyl-CoA carboxylase biotin carboxylase subunit [candidate division KSB1 bacterium]MDZ7307222.1 acetyl-CoA carboxylase biotin carboxylase subunit [candidate division KSB1 bacterium]